MHSKGQVEISQIRHFVLGKLILNRAQESSVGCLILFDVLPKGAHSQRRTEPAAELFILPQHLQTALEPRDRDGEPGFLDLVGSKYSCGT